MAKKTKRIRCKDNKSVFDYSLLLRPNGDIQVFDEKGKPLDTEGTIKPPKLKHKLNARTLTIVEAEESGWIWLDPPGVWIQVY